MSMLKPSDIPRELVVNATSFADTLDSALVKKPAFGNLGSLRVEVRTHEEYLGVESAREKKEVVRKTDIFLIKADQFSNVPKRFGELNPMERVELQPIYDRFKEQRDSSDTAIVDWQAISESERLLLMAQGFHSVEQIVALPVEQHYKLGHGAEDLYGRARQHMAAKMEKRNTSDNEKVQHLLAEVARLSRENEEIRNGEFERHAAKAKKTRAPRGSKKAESDFADERAAAGEQSGPVEPGLME